ncbi:MAG: SDR family oxidoreductase [Candidatus Hydrogenedentes bacterium]|nr:SDR family oxidoreductase [Candidatus Hydrogenedentota bacterium]
MKQKLWVTGYGGFVASHVVKLAGPEWDVVALSRRELPHVNPHAEYRILDLLDKEAVTAAFTAAPPDVIIHCAAMADIDYSERNPEEATAINVGVPALLANLCRAHETRFIFCSTDTVFDGEKGSYREADLPHPVNHYGRTKAEAERIVAEALEDHVIARVALVMGLPALSGGNTFLAKLMNNLEAGTATPFPQNEVRSPIDAITLATALLELGNHGYNGILHLAGASQLNRYKIGRHIAKHLGYTTDLITTAAPNAMKDRATRPRDVSLDVSWARQVLVTPMLTIEESLKLIFNDKE